MIIFVKLFGIAIVIMGIIFLIEPKTLKRYISFWKQKKRLRIGGISAIPIGVIFLIAAPHCRLAWLITVLGVWSIIKGTLLLTVSHKRIYAYLDWWLNKSIPAVRYIGLFVVAFGILIVYSA